MSAYRSVKIECDMSYGTLPCPRFVWCSVKWIPDARSNARYHGWTVFRAVRHTNDDGTVVTDQVDACPVCSRLLGKHTIEFLHGLTREELVDLKSKATEAVSQMGGHLPRYSNQ